MRKMQVHLLFRVAILATFMVLTGPANAYETDEAKLSEAKRSLYVDARETLDDWTGETEKLSAAGAKIESFIRTDPDFLPIYIEKSRLLIMQSATAQSDFYRLHAEALEILRTVQARDPQYPTSYVLAGHAYTNIRDYASATKSLEQASKLTDSDPWLYLNWSALYQATNQIDKALSYALKGLATANQNGKALVAAVHTIGKYSGTSNAQQGAKLVTDLVFEKFKEPLSRLRLADRLVGAYGGRPAVLDYAHAIISRQKDETPNLPEIDISMAELYLAAGFRVRRDEINLYDPKFSQAADGLLAAVKSTETTKSRIFADRFKIAIGNRDLLTASSLIADAQKTGVNLETLEESRATLLWIRTDYTGVIAIFEALARRDPKYGVASMLASAYAKLGRFDKIIALKKSAVDRNPSSAWALGDYAQVLLFSADDIDGAIEFGNKALQQMAYPIARNVTALAYLIKAAILNDKGDVANSGRNLAKAEAIGINEQYVTDQCMKYCEGVQKMLKKRSGEHVKSSV